MAFLHVGRISFITSAVLLATALGGFAEPAAGQVFSNPTPINLPGGPDFDPVAGVPYGTSITVGGSVSSINNIAVRIEGLSHVNRGAVSLLLVPPTGQAVELMSLVGSPNAANSAFLTFVADSGYPVPGGGVLTSGVFSPTVALSVAHVAPAPGQPYAQSLAPLVGTDPRGVWTLYVLDAFGTFNGGQIANGWSLLINQTTPALPDRRSITYQGRLNDVGGTPVNGLADLRFSLWNSAVSLNLADRRANPITLVNQPVANGLFTVEVPFGSVLSNPGPAWLQVEAAFPPGSAFVRLTPRQPITLAPIAARALVADLATLATNATNATTATTATNATSAVRINASADSFLNDRPIYLRAEGNVTSGLEWLGPVGFAGITVDGPVLYGFGGGVLGTTVGTERPVLLWNSAGNVGVGTTIPAARLHVAGTPGVDGIRFPDDSLQTSAAPVIRRTSLAVNFGAVGNGLTFFAEFAGPPGGSQSDVVIASARGGLPGGVSITQANITATGNINFRLENRTGGVLDLPLITFDFIIIR